MNNPQPIPIIPLIHILPPHHLPAHQQRLETRQPIPRKQPRKTRREIRPVHPHPVHALLHAIQPLLVRRNADTPAVDERGVNLRHAHVEGITRPLIRRHPLLSEMLQRSVRQNPRHQRVVRVHYPLGDPGAAGREGDDAGVLRGNSHTRPPIGILPLVVCVGDQNRHGLSCKPIPMQTRRQDHRRVQRADYGVVSRSRVAGVETAVSGAGLEDGEHGDDGPGGFFETQGNFLVGEQVVRLEEVSGQGGGAVVELGIRGLAVPGEDGGRRGLVGEALADEVVEELVGGGGGELVPLGDGGEGLRGADVEVGEGGGGGWDGGEDAGESGGKGVGEVGG